MYKREKDSSLREINILPQRRRTPSFSSSLLDAIYRSIDDSNDVMGGGGGEELSFLGEKTMLKKQRNYTTVTHGGSLEEYSNFQRASVIENWMEKQSSLGGSMHFANSTFSSSDSSSAGGLFSSSEAESSSYKEKSTRSKAVRHSLKCVQFEQTNEERHHCRQAPKREGGGFTKTKLKAMKIYDELKKVKQPISPGGRITSFFNSIFSSGNAKKVNLCTVKAMEEVNFDQKSKSTCSSASRSCLSKAPSSSKFSSSNGGMKRTVRFYPVSVIVDEDCKPCGHKCIYEDDPSLMPSPTAHQQILKSLSLKEDLKKNEFVSSGFGVDVDVEDEDEEDDDDASSYSSSDLFELDHLVGTGRYREELPVYETTNLKTNQAIAKGLIL